jgi:hypothetical protein
MAAFEEMRELEDHELESVHGAIKESDVKLAGWLVAGAVVSTVSTVAGAAVSAYGYTQWLKTT